MESTSLEKTPKIIKSNCKQLEFQIKPCQRLHLNNPNLDHRNKLIMNLMKYISLQSTGIGEEQTWTHVKNLKLHFIIW